MYKKIKNKKYSNPFFKKKRKNKIFNEYSNLFYKIKISIIIFIFILIVSTCFLIYSSYFNIKNIEINGKGNIDNKIIKELVWKQTKNNLLIFVPQKNIFLFNKNKISLKLAEKYSFDLLKIKKRLPDILIIEYNEKKYSFIWKEKEKYYYADLDGKIITDANYEEIALKNYPIIINNTDKTINNKQLPIEKKDINFIINLYSKNKKLEKNGIIIKKYIIDNEMYTIKAVIETGTKIFFNTRNDIDSQVDKINIIKNKMTQTDFNLKEYIDVRYGNSVYFK